MAREKFVSCMKYSKRLQIEAHIEIKFFTDDGYNLDVYGVIAANKSDMH